MLARSWRDRRRGFKGLGAGLMVRVYWRRVLGFAFIFGRLSESNRVLEQIAGGNTGKTVLQDRKA